MKQLILISTLSILALALTIPAFAQRTRDQVQTVVVTNDNGVEVTYVNLQKRMNKLLASRKMRRDRQVLLYDGPNDYQYFANIQGGEVVAPTILNGQGENLEYVQVNRVWHFPDQSLGDDDNPDAAGSCIEDDYEFCMICIEDAEYATKQTCYYHCCKIIYLPN